MSCDMSELNKRFGVMDRTEYFEKSNGGRASAVFWEGFFIWENGSNREVTNAPGGGVMQDATWVDKKDLHQVREILWYRIQYYRIKLDNSIDEFEQAKSELKSRLDTATAHGTEPPEESEYRQVKRLRNQTVALNRKLNELLEEANPEPAPYQPSEEELKIQQRNRNDADKIMNKLSKLEV